MEAKEAVEVIEASDVIMSVEVIEATKAFRTTQILRIKNLMAKSPYFDVLRKKCFLIDSWNFSEILPSLSELRLWRTGVLLLTKSKDHKSNSHYPGFPNYLQTKSNLHISIC